MSADNVVEFHAPSGEDGRPLYTTPQERDAFCFSQGYSVGYAQGQADAAQMFMDEAEDDMRRWRGQVSLTLVGGMLLGVSLALMVRVVVSVVQWWLS